MDGYVAWQEKCQARLDVPEPCTSMGLCVNNAECVRGVCECDPGRSLGTLQMPP